MSSTWYDASMGLDSRLDLFVEASMPKYDDLSSVRHGSELVDLSLGVTLQPITP